MDHGVIVERTRAVARLVTSETTLRDVVVYQNRLLGSTKRSLVVVTGKVLSGFDLDRGTEVQGGPRRQGGAGGAAAGRGAWRSR